MSLRVGDSGGFRDQPQYVSLGGDVLRREVARCGFLQGQPSPGSLASGTADDSTYLRGDGTWAHIEAVRFPVKNNSGGTLAIGTPVYISGYVGASGRAEVSAARADTAANMPAIGLLEEELLNNGEGYATSFGVVKNLNTAGYGVNGVVYVAAAGGLTTTRPTAAGHLVQNIGRVLRDHASTGEILVMGPGRTNAVPNYTASRLLGRGASGGDGDAQEITVGSGLTLTGTTLTASGGGGGEITSAGFTMLDDYIVGRSTGVAGQQPVAYLSVGKGLQISGGGIRVADLGIDTLELKASAVTYSKIQNVSATDKLIGRSSAGAGVVEEITCTAAGRAIIDDADAAAQRTTLGLGTLATKNDNSGKTTIDFGAFPGKSDSVVTVTGQTGIVSGSVVQAWLVPEATADHTADEHRLETISIMAGNIVANTSFDIYAQNTSQLNEPLRSEGNNKLRNALTIDLGDSAPSIGGRGTRIYGTWTVAWRWN